MPPLDRRTFVRALGALPLFASVSKSVAMAGEPSLRPNRIDEIFCLDDAERIARDLVEEKAFTYIQSGAAEEITLRWNRERFHEIRLQPRVLNELGDLDISVELLGRRRPMPVLFSPTGLNRLAHPDGEIAVAQGAGATGTTYVLSTGATTSVEDVAKAATAPVWFQLYVQRDPAYTRDLVRRAEAAGVEALCITVDAPVAGARTRAERAGFRLPPGMREPHLDAVKERDSVATLEQVLPVRQTWKLVEELISFSRRPVFLKGITHPDDAIRAIAIGAAGVIVSNHGARNLDTQPATIDTLPRVTAAVAGRVPVLIDGGIRRGTDVIKAFALGASAVLIGRPYLYGLSAGGADGVARIQKILRKEIKMALALIGRPSLASVDRSVLWS